MKIPFHKGLNNLKVKDLIVGTVQETCVIGFGITDAGYVQKFRVTKIWNDGHILCKSTSGGGNIIIMPERVEEDGVETINSPFYIRGLKLLWEIKPYEENIKKLVRWIKSL